MKITITLTDEEFAKLHTLLSVPIEDLPYPVKFRYQDLTSYLHKVDVNYEGEIKE